MLNKEWFLIKIVPVKDSTFYTDSYCHIDRAEPNDYMVECSADGYSTQTILHHISRGKTDEMDWEIIEQDGSQTLNAISSVKAEVLEISSKLFSYLYTKDSTSELKDAAHDSYIKCCLMSLRLESILFPILLM